MSRILFNEKLCKNRPAYFLVCLLLMVSCASTSEAYYSGGTGEPNNPFKISTPQDLNDIGNHEDHWDKHFILTNDVNLAEYAEFEFSVIGDKHNTFHGVFDGKGYEVSNFTYDSNGADYIGIFGYVSGSGSVVKNVTFIDPQVNAQNGRYVGALVGYLARGTITNCHVHGGTVSGTVDVGGLVGYCSRGIVTGCSSTLTVVGMRAGTPSGSYVGGLVGRHNGGQMFACYSTADVGGSTSVGGLTGFNAGNIYHCYARAIVEGDRKIGGLVGEQYGEYGVISNCFAAGLVTGSSAAGGLVGAGSAGGVLSSFWDIEASTQSESSGGVGKTTAQMMLEPTFTDAGWDFVSETANGVSDLWAMPDVPGYPGLWWQVLDLPPLPGFSGGSGTETDPYIMEDSNDLNAIGWNPRLMAAHFELTDDVNLAGIAFHLIGDELSPFSGCFEGNDRTISNFTCISDATENVGFFGYLGKDGSIRDLTLENVHIEAANAEFVGAIVGQSNGEIVDCCSAGIISAETFVGGLVGSSSGLLTGCHAAAQVIGTDRDVGGLAGVNEGDIVACSAAGAVRGNDSVGGLVGVTGARANITDSYSEAPVEATGYRVGGLVGWNTWFCSVLRCHSEDAVVGASRVGGLVGQNEGCTTECSSKSAVLGDSRVGGLAGYNFSGGRITDSYSNGSVTGEQYIGGSVGYNDHATMTNVYSTGRLSGRDDVGGLVGYNWPPDSAADSSFWDIETSRYSISAGGDGKSTVEMSQLQTFSDAGWDFVGERENGPSDTWAMPPDLGYPVLWWQLETPPPLPAFSGGSGTDSDPYILENADDLSSIGHNPRLMDRFFKLVSDIDLAGKSPFLIGSEDYPFCGVFDGNGSKLRDFTLRSDTRHYVGLFRLLGTGGQIRDLGLENVDIEACSAYYVGGLVGTSNGRVTSCYTTGRVLGHHRTGGIVGDNDGTIADCISTARVSGDDGIGGLAGSNEGVIANCKSTGSVIGDWIVGGLVGSAGFGGRITQCCSTAVVSGRERVGGLAGENYKGCISDCYSTGSVSGEGLVGGLVGYDGIGAIVTDCYSNGWVLGATDVGGLIGEVFDLENVRASFWDTSSSGQHSSAGGTGKDMVEMSTRSTFAEPGWDFVDIWTICEGTNYPRFLWQVPPGDIVCPDGVNGLDFAVLARYWHETNCAALDDCEGADTDLSGGIDFADVAVVAESWLSGL